VQLAVEPAFIPPARFERKIVAATVSACSDLRIRHRKMYAGTWHDAGIMATRVPTGMLLVPSRGGITHTPQEHTPEEDLVNGARALLRATQRAVAALGLLRVR
jgi:acetylornithine deacetylase/succinyl-diaminopimelate desuccinylase-like protein